jgi:hypothetical protein
MTQEFEYYLISSTYPDNVPLLQDDEELDPVGVAFLDQYRTVKPDYVAHVTFGPPIPSKPRLSDAMSLNGSCSVFSKKIYDTLSQHEIKGLQLVPTIIRGRKDETFDNYLIANIYQEMAFFDEKETEYGWMNEMTEEWEDIEKIVLDREKLAAGPLEDRLVFVSKEACKFILYHKSVVDIIMAVNPEGIVFTPVEEWYEG